MTKKDTKDHARSEAEPDRESEEGKSRSAGHDQDSSVSRESDTDDHTSRIEDDEEDWIDYIKRTTREAEEN